MSDFVKGFISCAGGALVFGVFLIAAYFIRRRYPREPLLDELDFDQAAPDGFVEPFLEDKR